MPLLSSIIAKVMAMTDAILGVFVQVTPGVNPLPCGTMYTASTSMTGCGNAVVSDLGGIIGGVVHLIPFILAGLFAT